MEKNNGSQFDRQDRVSMFFILNILLSLYVLLALGFQLIYSPGRQVTKILDVLDFMVCIVFMSDFFRQLVSAKNKLSFLKWGWIDFLSGIPYLLPFRIFRFKQIIYAIRVLRTIKSIRLLFHHFFINRARGTFATAAIVSCVMILFSSLAILQFENIPSGNIHTPIDAFWWAFTTISTSESGGYFAITLKGKLLSVFLSICGIGLFGTFTAFVADFFLKQGQGKESEDIRRIQEELQKIQSCLNGIESTLSPQEKKQQPNSSHNHENTTG